MANPLANPLPLSVSSFTNPSGKTVYRVSGTLPSGRVRKNFKLEAKALAYVRDNTPALSFTGPAPVMTRLSELQVRQAEAAFLRLPAGVGLLEPVDFYLENHKPVTALPMLEAISVFGDWLRSQRKCEEVTIETRTHVLTAFSRYRSPEGLGPARFSDRIGVDLAKSWIYSAEVAERTQRDRFDLLNWFCTFLVSRKLAATNPVSEFAQDRPVVKVKTPGVLTFAEGWRLLQCALTDAEGPEMLPFFAICLLSGVRPDEVLRLKPGDFYLDDEHRIIEVNLAKGGRARRQVTVHEPLWRILTWCKAQELSFSYFSKRKFDRIRRRACVIRKWEKDILRHSYASHRYILDHDVKTLESDMGNSERVLFQNYIRPVPRADALKFTGLVLHFTAPREKSAMGTGKKFRRAHSLTTTAHPAAA